MPVKIKASLWFMICAFINAGISMISTPIFTRLLNTAEYGQFNVFNSWLSIVRIIVSMNLAAGVYAQGLIKFDKDRDVFSSSLQGLSTVLVLAWTIVYLCFKDFWNNLLHLTTVQILAMLVMIWTTAAFNFWSCNERVEFRYRALVAITLIIAVSKPLVGVVFVLLAEDKVTARILGLVLVELVVYSGLAVIQLIRGKKFYSKQYWKYALLFNIPLIPHYLSQVVLNSADRIMIKEMVGKSEAGIYSLAYSLSSVVKMFNTALMQALSPWMYQKIKDKKSQDMAPMAYSSLTIVAIANLMLILFAPEAVAIFAPESYYDAIWVVPPVAMSVYFVFGYDLFAKFAFYYEKTKLIMVATTSGAILNIVLNLIFIRKYGYIAAGYTTLICYAAYTIAHYYLMTKMCDRFCDGIRPYSLKKILSITIPFVLAGFGVLLTYNHPIVRYGLIAIMVIIGIVKRKEICIAFKKIFMLKKQKTA